MTKVILHTIIKDLHVESITGSADIAITDIQTDSRLIGSQQLFVAINGVAVDGHTFIDTAISQGANCIVCEELPENIQNSICYIKVANSAEFCGKLLTKYYNIDFNKLQVVGITGTNGKTTTATLLYKLFTKLGNKTGLLSTVRNVINTEELPATHTTPDTIQLFKLLSQMQAAGCTYCFMEVSSHAIHQHRISGIEFKGGIFTNITQDHLDYHKTFAEYIKAKKIFFDTLPKNSFALTNNDDKNGLVMLQNTKANTYTYSQKGFSDFKCKLAEMHLDGMLLVIDGTEVWTKFLGAFNAYNLLSVYATAILLNQNKETVLQLLSSLSPADGRLEFFKNKDGKTAIVDYAHTPDALENVLTTLRKQCTEQNQIITVVGAGGDRDTTKRPIMGNIAAKHSDKVIFTSDNPRSEDPQLICNQMADGVSTDDFGKTLIIIDRKEAIKTALLLAKPSDLILIAGKGHEDYQIINGVKHHFDDREIIKELFKL